MASHYKQIDGVQYSREILDMADELMAGKGDGRISIEDANTLFAQIEKDGKYSDLEKRTIAYLRDDNSPYNFTDAANDALRTKIRSWAATRGHQNKDE